MSDSVVFVRDPSFAKERYEVRDSASNGVEIVGSSRRARVYGIGRYLRDRNFRGGSEPAQSLRGIYLSTHFGNWYDNADDAAVIAYVEDLALWGCNQVRVWFDMHDYASADDPRAQPRVKRLRMILKAVADCGLETSMVCLANESFASSPESLRADWRGGKNGYERDLCGHYHVEICPSKPGGLELILKSRSEVLDLFSDVGLSDVSYFPYDQGGCTCADCAPWGCNGLLKILPQFSELVRRKMPGCRIEFGTWYFDHFGSNLGEWRGLKSRFVEVSKYIDALSVENLDAVGNVIPGGLSASSMPEISMRGMLPWGGFGANPQPQRLLGEFRRGSGCLTGVRPYSEGIYEDLNKVILLRLGWNPKASVESAVREYAAFYFGASSCHAVAEGVALLERNLGHTAVLMQEGRSYDAYQCGKMRSDRPFRIAFGGRRPDRACAAKARQLFEEVDAALASDVRRTWRWRILLLRARIDDLLAGGAAIDSRELSSCLTELAQIYRVSDNTEPFLTPPGPSLRPNQFHAGGL